MLISVFDKSSIVTFAQRLKDLGAEIVSSGGTARTLAEAGIDCIDVADLTGYPPILSHRVVTLHPLVHGGLLGNPSDPDHAKDFETYGIKPFDMVVGNLYPFSAQPSIEMIDIGGPSMLRSAAKNHHRVTVVVDPSDYDSVLAEITEHGDTTLDTRVALARKAFAHTAAYDAAIVNWFDAAVAAPDTKHLTLERHAELRYGENPHQAGALYTVAGASSWWSSARQLGGKELSYLNVFDTDAAWRLAHSLGDAPAAIVIKHANPCGAAIGIDVADAYRKAHLCDPVSAFGGIVAVNRAMTAEAARALTEVFTEVIIAPSFDDDALTILGAKKNLRIIAASAPEKSISHMRTVGDAMLIQDRDVVTFDRSACTVPSNSQPSESDWVEAEFAWRVCASVSSNAIVLTANEQAFGIGAGQQNRVESAAIAVRKAHGRARGGAAASDAFFPFRDGFDEVARSGVRVVVEPGGSVRDQDVIDAANEHGIALIFTGKRHFRH